MSTLSLERALAPAPSLAFPVLVVGLAGVALGYVVLLVLLVQTVI